MSRSPRKAREAPGQSLLCRRMWSGQTGVRWTEGQCPWLPSFSHTHLDTNLREALGAGGGGDRLTVNGTAFSPCPLKGLSPSITRHHLSNNQAENNPVASVPPSLSSSKCVTSASCKLHPSLLAQLFCFPAG